MKRLLLLLLFVVVSDALSATYYVRKTGNDGTGDGSTGNPWLTVDKGISMLSAGDILMIGDGTYAENSGSGYLAISRSFASYVTIQSESQDPTKVVILNVSGNYGTVNTGEANYYRWNDITFSSTASAANAPLAMINPLNHWEFNRCVVTPGGVVPLYSVWIKGNSGVIQNLAFNNCTINYGGYTYHQAVNIIDAGSGNTTAITFNDCTITGTRRGVMFDGTSGTITFNRCAITAKTEHAIFCADTIANVTLTDCDVTGGTGGSGQALSFNGATNITVTGGTYRNSDANTVVQFGYDGPSGGLATTGTIKDVTIVKPLTASGHALMLGNGITSFTADGIIVNSCYDYAVVVKCNSGVTVKNSRLFAGQAKTPAAAIYVKGATGATIQYNSLFAVDSGYCFQLLNEETTTRRSLNTTFTNNLMAALGNSAIYNIGGTAHDSGGTTVNYNIIDISRSTGKIGSVRTTSSITSLAGLRTAWSGYSVTGNDALSTTFLYKSAFLFFHRQ